MIFYGSSLADKIIQMVDVDGLARYHSHHQNQLPGLGKSSQRLSAIGKGYPYDCKV